MIVRSRACSLSRHASTPPSASFAGRSKLLVRNGRLAAQGRWFGAGGCYQWLMRLFVAIALPPEAASELDEVVAPLRPSWPELRCTGVDAWHLTLAFLGEVDEVVTGSLAPRIHNAARRHPPLPSSLPRARPFPAPTL